MAVEPSDDQLSGLGFSLTRHDEITVKVIGNVERIIKITIWGGREMDQIFAEATRMRLRFPGRGQMSVEDLWSLKLEDLDNIYKILNGQLRKEKEDSLLGPKEVSTEILEIKIAVVKYIAEYMKAKREMEELAVVKAMERQRILDALDEKKNDNLKSLSEDELKERLAKL
jgi:NurA-like 5'-3' nuclease